MVPTTRNLLHHDGNSSGGKPCCHPGQYRVGIAAQLEASAAAARQQDHRKTSRSPRRLAMGDDDEQAAAAAGTSSRGGSAAGDDGDWLQLSLAGAGAGAVASSSSASSSGDNISMDPPPTTELDLLTYDDKRNARMRPPPLFPLPLRSYHQSYHGRGRYRPAAASGSLSAPSLTFTPSLRTSGDAMTRVISPPRRRETEAAAGLWLKLEAAPNQ